MRCRLTHSLVTPLFARAVRVYPRGRALGWRAARRRRRLYEQHFIFCAGDGQRTIFFTWEVTAVDCLPLGLL